MEKKSLENSRLEFIWETNMIETRCNWKVNYKKDEYQCLHYWEGNQPVPPTFWFAQPTLTASDKHMRM